METLPKHPLDDRSGVTHSEPDGSFSRRAMLAGTVAATAAAAVVPIAGSAYAAGPDVDSKQDMMAFLLLSAALTGVHVVALAPEFSLDPKKEILDQNPGADPINIKNVYFTWIVANESTPSFGNLIQIAKDNRQSARGILAAVNASDDDTKFLARSIVLLWYLGSWYKPGDLKANAATPGNRALTPSVVVSPKAYTQGLVWQIVGAHPEGYSNLQFGYWSRDPNDPNNPAEKSNRGIITATIP